MTFSKVFYHDLRCGLGRLRYAIVPLLVLLSLVNYYMVTKGDSLSETWMDIMCYLFKGAMPMNESSNFNEKVQLPILWIYTIGCSLILTLDYILCDLTQNGQQVIIRCGNRWQWFMSKCLWNLLSSVCFFVLFAATTALFSLAIDAELSLYLTPGIWQKHFETELGNSFSVQQVLLSCLILPFVTLATLNLLEMTLCLFVKPILSFLSCIGLLIVAVWIDNDFVLGCGGMTLRNVTLCENAVSLLHRGLVAIVYIGVCVLVGGLRLKFMDILPVEE